MQFLKIEDKKRNIVIKPINGNFKSYDCVLKYAESNSHVMLCPAKLVLIPFIVFFIDFNSV